MEKTIEKLQTARFGEIEIDNSLIFNFVSPIIGYTEHKKFALVDYRSDSPFKWLQSMEDKDLSFPITHCKYFNINYEFELSDEDAQTLDIEKAEDILALNIVTIPETNPQGATINLLAPIIVNINTNNAMQVVLKDGKYQIREPLFKEEKTEEEKK